jgi:cytochrome c oxidase subunit 2
MDAIPNKTNRVWIEPRRVGTFVGQCAEYCGLQHALMLLVVVVHPKDEFRAWVAAQQTVPAEHSATRAGRELFASLACVNCHSVRGTPGNGVFGPDLTHLMSRSTLGAGAARNTPENLRTWVKDPGALKAGALMPAMKLDDAQLDQLLAYLVTLR